MSQVGAKVLNRTSEIVAFNKVKTKVNIQLSIGPCQQLRHSRAIRVQHAFKKHCLIYTQKKIFKIKVRKKDLLETIQISV